VKKGIDVSAYQGKINWKKVKDAGCEFSIIRTTTQNNKIDTCFDFNLKGCVDNNIAVSYYKYTYAISFTELYKELEHLFRLFNSVPSSFRVVNTIWWDVEYEPLKNMGNKELTMLIKKAESEITAAGFPFGIYTGYSFYNANYFCVDEFSCPFWIARYPLNKNYIFSDPIPENYKPNIPLIKIWQYTSKGIMRGISNEVDFNILYVDNEL